MDGLEERQTGRGSDGLVQGGVQVSNGRDQQGRDQQKGKRKKELEERENMTAKDDWEAREPDGTRGVLMNRVKAQEPRGR